MKLNTLQRFIFSFLGFSMLLAGALEASSKTLINGILIVVGFLFSIIVFIFEWEEEE